MKPLLRQETPRVAEMFPILYLRWNILFKMYYKSFFLRGVVSSLSFWLRRKMNKFDRYALMQVARVPFLTMVLTSVIRKKGMIIIPKVRLGANERWGHKGMTPACLSSHLCCSCRLQMRLSLLFINFTINYCFLLLYIHICFHNNNLIQFFD